MGTYTWIAKDFIKKIQTNHKLTIQTGWQTGKANYKNENNE